MQGLGDGGDLQVRFLRDAAQPATDTAQALASFIVAATSTLDIAVYDCALDGDCAEIVRGALQDAARRGVSVRFAYFGGPHSSPFVPPPQPGPSGAFAASCGVPTRPISGFQSLMHHKYAARDAAGNGAVWTGSTNWTVDSWSREENIILEIPSPELARFYVQDFDELWNSESVENTGGGDGGEVTLQFNGKPAPAQVWFSPGSGEDMAADVAHAIAQASQRIVVATPVLTVGNILGALRDVAAAGTVPVSGVYDRTQMDEVHAQWAAEENAHWKIEAFDTLVNAAHLAGKRSTPFGSGTVHDYLHVKLMIIDNLVFTGSYNFSHSGETNAENLLRVENEALADACAAYVQELIKTYGGS